MDLPPDGVASPAAYTSSEDHPPVAKKSKKSKPESKESKENKERREAKEGDEDTDGKDDDGVKTEPNGEEGEEDAEGPGGQSEPAAMMEIEEKEEDTTSYVVGKPPLRGKVWRNKATGDYLRYKCIKYDVEYRPGDTVFMESQRPDQPFYICIILDFKKSNNKRDNLSVHIKWFYRTSEVPDQVYQLLIHDRHVEHGRGGTASMTARQRKLKQIMYRQRELFISEMTDTYPVSVLRGKCGVVHCMDLQAIKDFSPEENTFFYTLSYNPETRRMASIQGEIRVGASHQAKLPEYEGEVPIDRRPEPWGEEIAWRHDRIHDHDLMMYLRAVRSMAAFAAMCDGGTPEEGFSAASKDGITAQAIATLHEADYDTGSALQALLKTPFHADIFRHWDEEDIKNFIKGLRVHGKNFFKIRMDFLPERDTADLVEFYYLWKKTTGAAGGGPRGRRHRPSVMRKIGGAKASKASKNVDDDPDYLSSCSEPEELEDKEEGGGGEEGTGEGDGEKKLSPYYCRHCFTDSSNDWHHGGKDKILICTDCRIFFKRYAELPNMESHLKKDEEIEAELKREQEEEEEVADVGATELVIPKVEDTLNINAIEQDSATASPAPPVNDISEPMEIKAEVPRHPALGLLSPVATMPQQGLMAMQQQQQARPHPAAHFPPGGLPPPAAHCSPATTPGPGGPLQQPPPAHAHSSSRPPMAAGQQHRPMPASSSSHHDDIQVLGERQGNNTMRTNPTPPPRIDGSECHRSQSAIFIRYLFRGEGNSCSRTDMNFKPVPDSKLARKRDERARKANEREEAMKAEVAASKRPPGAGPPHPMFPGDPFGRPSPSLAGRFPPPHHLSEQERRMFGPAPPPLARPLPPGFGPAPPPPGPNHSSSMHLAAAAAEQRQQQRNRMQEQLMAAEHHAAAQQRANVLNAERQYAERMSAALTTDPLVRLQMAGINTDIPGVGGVFRPAPPPHHLMMQHRPPAHSASGGAATDHLSRMMMEREQHMAQQAQAQAQAAQAAQAQQNLFAAHQQEQFLRFHHQEALARQAAADAASRP